MRRMLLIALLCWATPLVAGTAVFWLYLETDWLKLRLAGLYVFLFGVLCFVAGVGALIIYLERAGRTGSTRSGYTWLRAALVAALLVSNFPVAFGLAERVVERDFETIHLAIKNDSPRPLTQVRIGDGSRELLVAPIAPGQSFSQNFWIPATGKLKVNAAGYDEMIVSRQKPDSGGNWVLTYDTKASVNVSVSGSPWRDD